MTHQEFHALVARIESSYAGRPDLLQRRVLWWAAIGYGGFAGWIAGVILLAALFVTLGVLAGKGGILFYLIAAAFLFGGGWWVARALWISLPAPEGREVTRDEVPKLFACLDEIQVKCGSTAFDSVFIVPDFNAAVAHRPRLGMLGWWRQYLLIGLPLLDLLSEAELKAVLAHEFAHLSKKHGKTGHWIYRLRASWEFLFTEYLNRPHQQDEVSSRVFFRKYVSWFWPHFNAHAFVLSRANEYDADSVAASIAGQAATANALSRIRIYGDAIDENFWSDLWQLATANPEPPSDVFDRIKPFIDQKLAGKMEEHLAKAILCVTTNNDTHPCLEERLTNLGCERLPELELVTDNGRAGDILLGAAQHAIRKDVTAAWQKNCLEAWKKRHARAVSLGHQIERLDGTVAGLLDPEALWDKARAILDLQGDAAAEGLLRQILALKPDHAPANFCLGRFLLSERKSEGELLVERAIAQQESLLPQGCKLLFAYYRDQGDQARLAALRKRMDEHEKRMEASAKERQSVAPSDTFVDHGLGGADLGRIVEALQKFPEIAAAHLARKQLQVFKEEKLFVMSIRRVRAWHRLPNSSAEEELVSRLTMAVPLPGRAFVVAESGSFRGVAKKVKTLHGALIFSRSTNLS
jgi:Zn-dependent protease with chaperone function